MYLIPFRDKNSIGYRYEFQGQEKDLEIGIEAFQLHMSNDAGATIDNLVYDYKSGTNQLDRVNDLAGATTVAYDIEPQSAVNYTYNAIGQMTANVSEGLTYFYNAHGLTTEVRKNGLPIVKFFYDEGGIRIRKESFNLQGDVLSVTYYVVDLSGNVLAVYNKIGSVTSLIENPIYGLDRLGTYNVQSASASYELKDHLGNIRAVFKKGTTSGTFSALNYADYYPFGEQWPGSRSMMSNYRYGYQGQELDQETGFEAFALRLWDGRIGRWMNPDPYGQYVSPYLGMGNNPVSRKDPDGGADGCFDVVTGEPVPCGDHHEFDIGGVRYDDDAYFKDGVFQFANSMQHRELEELMINITNANANDSNFNANVEGSFTEFILRSQIKSSEISGYDIDAAISGLNRRAKPFYNDECGWCAMYVRLALVDGGINTSGNPGHAREYDIFLPKLGFKELKTENYLPIAGDMAVFQSVAPGKSGHLQMFNGKQWVSDYKQKSFYPGSAYKTKNIKFQIFR